MNDLVRAPVAQAAFAAMRSRSAAVTRSVGPACSVRDAEPKRIVIGLPSGSTHSRATTATSRSLRASPAARSPSTMIENSSPPQRKHASGRRTLPRARAQPP